MSSAFSARKKRLPVRGVKGLPPLAPAHPAFQSGGQPPIPLDLRTYVALSLATVLTRLPSATFTSSR